MQYRYRLHGIGIFLLLGVTLVAGAQSRKLGPDTAKSIQEAKLDPTFATSRIEQIAIVPLVSATDDKDAANLVAKNLVAQLRLRADLGWTVVAPDQLLNFVTSSKLDDEFNMFFGDFSGSGTIRQSFIDVLRSKLKVDAVFVGTITAYGQTKSSGPLKVFGKGKENLVGLEMGLYRTTDGRRIWWGKDLIAAQRAEDLPHAAEAIGEVFARFVGRRAY